MPGLTTKQIVSRARMSRKTFYTLFDDKAACLEFACEAARDQPIEKVGRELPAASVICFAASATFGSTTASAPAAFAASRWAASMSRRSPRSRRAP